MRARVGVLLHGLLVFDGWFGSANEVWDDRARETTEGGVHVGHDDIVLERAARSGLLAPARWVVTAEAARIDLHGGEQ